jgi:hypothetical protein
MIDTLIERFKRHSDYSTPRLATFKCHRASEHFQMFALGAGEEARIVQMSDPRFRYIKRVAIFHVAVYLPKYGWVVDWTARQFTSRADYPLKLTLKECEKFWHKVWVL